MDDDEQFVTKKTCPRCHGTRTEPNRSHACRKCGGTGEIHSTRSLKEMAAGVEKLRESRGGV
jgi:uncharacterized phage protein